MSFLESSCVQQDSLENRRNLVEILRHFHSPKERMLAHFVHTQHLLDTRQLRAAACAVKSQNRLSFESVSLGFVSGVDATTLTTYLSKTVCSLSRKHKSQQVMICTWLLELLLVKVVHALDITFGHAEYVLLLRHARSLPSKTACQFISSQECSSGAVRYAEKINAVHHLVMHFICEHSWTDILNLLKYQELEELEELFYDTSLVLLINSSSPTAQMWACHPRLHISKFMPGLIRNDILHAAGAPNCELVRQMIHFFSKSSVCESSIKRYLLSHIVDVVDVILSYLNMGSSNLFDVQYALRICHSRSQCSVCAWAYVYLGMYEEATNFALTFDIALARTFADLPEVPLWLKMILWLEVAKHIINDQSLALSESSRILDESPLLSLEEILPLFPDFVVIDTFKSELSGSIDGYDRNLKSLRTEMAASMDTSQSYTSRIIKKSSQNISIPVHRFCALSGRPILAESFQCFPSGLVYFPGYLHDDSVCKHTAHYTSTHTPRTSQSTAKFENCFFTGSHMIDSIDIPFFTELDTGKWQL